MSEKVNQALSNALGIDPIVKAEKTEIVEVLSPLNEQNQDDFVSRDQQEDYVLSRNTFRSLIRQGNDAIDNMNELAKQSESPRAYEVLATMMRTVADATKDLYDLQKKTKELKATDKSRPQDEQRINVEKAVFVGSTAALLKKVKNNEDI